MGVTKRIIALDNLLLALTSEMGVINRTIAYHQGLDVSITAIIATRAIIACHQNFRAQIKEPLVIKIMFA
jgi:hypothetical protein